MMKGLIRFGLVWAFSMMLTPYVHRFFLRLAHRAPQGSMLSELFEALAGRYTTSLIRSFGESTGDMVLGPKRKRR